ncbi:hypothetical protein [Streptomyces sp. CB00455]|uniref:hypothetical protein n=1 Tax=Streptomyces sp. CB00455 TaxID=1703927 RepID=UPI0011613056|nr:hypothetical protein [Streptomyces sp. CB00455]
MSDTRSTPRPAPRPAAGRATWSLPLLVLTPPAVIRLAAEPSGGWLVALWVFWAVGAVLVAAEWRPAARHGVRGRDLITCLIAHAVLVWHLVLLLFVQR